MVNRENVRKLVEALRSGEFKQGGGRLRRVDAYCCLGVASEICRRETGVGEWVDSGNSGLWDFEAQGEYRFGALHNHVKRWLGTHHMIDGDDPIVAGNHLSCHNDRGKSFAEIADMIEHEWLQDSGAAEA